MVKYVLMHNNEEIYKSNDLFEIDNYTMQFDDVYDFTSEFEINGISNFKIYYKIKKKCKQLDIAYSDKKKLKDIELLNSNKINQNNKIFKKTMSDIYKKLRQDHDFLKFVQNSDKINFKIKEYALKVSESYDTFFENKLSEHIGTYLQFRRFLFLIEEYEEEKNIKKIIPLLKENLV